MADEGDEDNTEENETLEKSVKVDTPEEDPRNNDIDETVHFSAVSVDTTDKDPRQPQDGSSDDEDD